MRWLARSWSDGSSASGGGARYAQWGTATHAARPAPGRCSSGSAGSRIPVPDQRHLAAGPHVRGRSSAVRPGVRARKYRRRHRAMAAPLSATIRTRISTRWRPLPLARFDAHCAVAQKPVSIVFHAENAGFIGSPWISKCPARLAAGSPLRGKHASLLQPYPCREDRGAFLRDFLGAFRAAAAVLQPGRTLPAIVLRRSEEHTSELQSLMRISYAVFCLQKKKKQHI